MAVDIFTFTLGPLENNTYVIVDSVSKTAVIIDPSFNSHEVVQAIFRRGLIITSIWITHAHFDHIAGVNEIIQGSKNPITIALHPLDLPLWQTGGGARMFGFSLSKLPDPDVSLHHGQVLSIGNETVEVRYTPGHCAGHVVFYLSSAHALVCGDVIFFHGIGRTDLPGGSLNQLEKSIREQIYTLPPETRLLSGHGPETTVDEEITANPYVRP
jgi:hydroxyacylglutathione hydrolase